MGDLDEEPAVVGQDHEVPPVVGAIAFPHGVVREVVHHLDHPSPDRGEDGFPVGQVILQPEPFALVGVPLPVGDDEVVGVAPGPLMGPGAVEGLPDGPTAGEGQAQRPRRALEPVPRAMRGYSTSPSA